MKVRTSFFIDEKTIKQLKDLKNQSKKSLNNLVELAINNYFLSNDERKFEEVEEKSNQFDYQFSQFLILKSQIDEEISTLKIEIEKQKTEIETLKSDKKTTMELLTESKNEFENWKKRINNSNLLLEKLKTDLNKLPFKTDDDKNIVQKTINGIKEKLRI